MQDVEAYAFSGDMPLEESVYSPDFVPSPSVRLEYFVSTIFAFARDSISEDSTAYERILEAAIHYRLARLRVYFEPFSQLYDSSFLTWVFGYSSYLTMFVSEHEPILHELSRLVLRDVGFVSQDQVLHTVLPIL